MRLHEVLASGRWFRRRTWRVASVLEPLVYRRTEGRLEEARATDVLDARVSERCFRPGEVLAADWEYLGDARQRRRPRDPDSDPAFQRATELDRQVRALGRELQEVPAPEVRALGAQLARGAESTFRRKRRGWRRVEQQTRARRRSDQSRRTT